MVGAGDDGRGREPRPWAPGPPPAVPNPGMMRVSDSERHAVAEILRDAAAEGRIDLTELDERLEATYAARTYADLVPITADLPGTRQDVPPVPSPPARAPFAPSYTSSFAVMSETRRSGTWRLEDGHTALALMGSVVLDLREAQLAQAETRINASAVMGGVEIVVGPHVQVVVEGVGFMGDYSESRTKVALEVGPGSPVVRVRGLALMGSVNVRRKALPQRGGTALR